MLLDCARQIMKMRIILEEIVCITLLLIYQESYFVYVRFLPLLA